MVADKFYMLSRNHTLYVYADVYVLAITESYVEYHRATTRVDSLFNDLFRRVFVFSVRVFDFFFVCVVCQYKVR